MASSKRSCFKSRRVGLTSHLAAEEKFKALVMFRSGNYLVREICDTFGIYPKELKRIAEEAGYGY